MKVLIAALALLCAGCVTSSDFRNLADRLDTYEIRNAEIRADDSKTYEEKLEALEESGDTLKDEIGEIADAVEDRIEAGLAAAKTPITGQPLVDLLLTMGITGVGTAFGVNRHRNKQREKRGEQV